MRVVFSAQSRNGLVQIGDYIARDNPRRAQSFVRELMAKARDIAKAPLLYPLISRYAHHGIRRCPCRDYLILYRAEADQILIIHILHGARDYQTLLFPGG